MRTKAQIALDRGLKLGLNMKQLQMAAQASDKALLKAGFDALIAGRPDIRDFFVGILEAREELREKKANGTPQIEGEVR